MREAPVVVVSLVASCELVGFRCVYRLGGGSISIALRELVGANNVWSIGQRWKLAWHCSRPVAISLTVSSPSTGAGLGGDFRHLRQAAVARLAAQGISARQLA
ncbi:MAG: hypothetical protein R3D25_09575 [Geminicoccaceae bacterium]